jgi:hypothetical protein
MALRSCEDERYRIIVCVGCQNEVGHSARTQSLFVHKLVRVQLAVSRVGVPRDQPLQTDRTVRTAEILTSCNER